MDSPHPKHEDLQSIRAADDDVSLVFAALADPTRRAILTRLAEGEATVNQLAEPFAMTFQAVSKHLKVLERAGLVSRGRQAQYRPVRLEPAGFDPVTRWIEEHRTMRLAQLDRLAQTIQSIRGRPDVPTRPDENEQGRSADHAAPQQSAPTDPTKFQQDRSATPDTNEPNQLDRSPR